MLSRAVFRWSVGLAVSGSLWCAVAHADGSGLQARQVFGPEPGKIAFLVEPENSIGTNHQSADFALLLHGGQAAPNVSVRKNSDRGGLLTLVVLDDSGSYRNLGGTTTARPVLQSYVTGLSAADRIGLVVFGADATVCPIRQMGSAFLSDLANPVQACGAAPSNLRATNLLSGLSAALQRIREEQEAKRALPGLSEILLFTDAGDEAAVTADDWRSIQTQAASLGVRVSAVLGDMPGRSGQQRLASLTRLRDLAAQANGVYDNSNRPATALVSLQTARDRQKNLLWIEAALCGKKAEHTQAGVDAHVEYSPGGQRRAWTGTRNLKPLWTAASEAPCPNDRTCTPLCPLWEQCAAGKCEPRICTADELCGPTARCTAGRCVPQPTRQVFWPWALPALVVPFLLWLLLRKKRGPGDTQLPAPADAPKVASTSTPEPPQAPVAPKPAAEPIQSALVPTPSQGPVLDPLPETHLVAIGGRVQVGEKWRLHKARMQVGGSRAEEDGNDMTFAVPQISSRHALFELYPSGALWITDLQARNGTFVNGRQLAPGERVQLRVGDQVKLSQQLILEVQRPGSVKTSATVEPAAVSRVESEPARPEAPAPSEKKRTIFDPGNR